MSATSDANLDQVGVRSRCWPRPWASRPWGFAWVRELLALASGGSVSAGAQGPEIGWAPVTLTPARQADPLFAGFPEAITVLHWHGDTFGLPGGATRLATNTTYPNQVFDLETASRACSSIWRSPRPRWRAFCTPSAPTPSTSREAPQ